MPAVAELRAAGIDVRGPLAADTMFHAAARSGYDAALCMYHDQALIPVKTIDFDGAVNVTLGLPFIRTSPDHGTAFDIAGSGTAPRKSLGQTFILDLNLTRRIARAAGPPDRAIVIEIGPGPGGLTRALLEEGAARIVAIERDPRCLAALAELASRHPGRLELV